MPRRRDRHDRGLRGPVVLALDPRRTPRRFPTGAEHFAECVQRSAERISLLNPGLLDHVDLGIEEVPTLRRDDDQVPLAAAIEATDDRPARVVVYRRPLEHRSTSRRHLARLVHRTVVKQVAALTARSALDIDPQLVDEDDED